MTTVVTNAGAVAALAFSPELIAVSMRKASAGAEDARRRAHVITGEMRRGIHVVPLLGGARVSGGSDHDIYEEFGTRYRPPHPFMRPSMDAARAG